MFNYKHLFKYNRLFLHKTSDVLVFLECVILKDFKNLKEGDRFAKVYLTLADGHLGFYSYNTNTDMMDTIELLKIEEIPYWELSNAL